MVYANPLPYDVNDRPIQAIKEVTAVANTPINHSSYVAVSVPTGIFCKAVMIKARGGASWRLATTGSPSTYMKISGTLTFNLCAEGDDVLFYARGDVASDTLELLFLD